MTDGEERIPRGQSNSRKSDRRTNGSDETRGGSGGYEREGIIIDAEFECERVRGEVDGDDEKMRRYGGPVSLEYTVYLRRLVFLELDESVSPGRGNPKAAHKGVATAVNERHRRDHDIGCVVNGHRGGGGRGGGKGILNGVCSGGSRRIWSGTEATGDFETIRVRAELARVLRREKSEN
ncbi:hypothetical protein DFH09DRAFT_1084476 [Mycena vulgaris]|nr:hypothetical protein DFH09DRAFT_1084476 [Mycena vulgaris]